MNAIHHGTMEHTELDRSSTGTLLIWIYIHSVRNELLPVSNTILVLEHIYIERENS